MNTNVYFEPRALELAEAFGRMAPEPTRSPSAAFDLTLRVFSVMMEDHAKPGTRNAYSTATGIQIAPGLLPLNGYSTDYLENEIDVGFGRGLRRVADYVPGAGERAVIDLTPAQHDNLNYAYGTISKAIGRDLHGPGEAFSVLVRYVAGVAALLQGRQPGRDCSLADNENAQVEGLPRNLYLRVDEGHFVQRRIQGLNF